MSHSPEYIEGPQGKPGLQGPKGEKGDRGPIGLEGQEGPRGEKGEQGIQGFEGGRGPRGPIGLEGERGPAGKDGKPGPKGDRGPAGQDGKDADASLIYPIVNTSIRNHEEKFDHTLIDPFLIGSKKLSEAGMEDGQVITYDKKGDRLIYTTIKQIASKIQQVGGRGLSLPSQSGNAGKFLTTDGQRSSWATAGGGTGDVVGPASATDSNFAAFDSTTGKLIKDSTKKASDFAAALGADDNYVTDAEKVVISHTSGTNTGDQTNVSGNAGTATALQTGRTIDGVTFDGTANITVIAPGTHAATGKTTPVDADEIPLVDSAAFNVLKKLTWANLKATLKSYFDTLYPSGSGTSSGTNTGDQLLFKTIAVSGQSDVVADTGADTLTLVAGSNVTITTDASTDTVTINAAGGSGSPSSPDKSIQFNTTGSFDGSSKLLWDDATSMMSVGEENSQGTIKGPNATTLDAAGTSIEMLAGNGLGDGNGGHLNFTGGDADGSGAGGDVSFYGGGSLDSGNGGNLSMSAGSGGPNSGDGGVIVFSGGNALGGGGDGGDLYLSGGSPNGIGNAGKLRLQDPVSFFNAAMDMSLLSADRTLTVPNATGTIALVQSINSISSPATAGAAAATNYVYLVSGTTTLTLPTAVGNTNLYTVKNVGVNTVTIATTSAQTIDGSSTASLPVRYTSLTFVSDNSNWNII